MRVLFVGGTGNLSADCASALHQRGEEILVLSRGRSAVPPEYRTLTADRRDLPGLRQILGGISPDVVINFLGFDLGDVEIDFELWNGRIAQYIFISSATVYAKPPVHLPLTEDAPLGNAYWEYARKKLDCEKWLLQACRAGGFPVTIVRPSHTYSKRWVPNAIASSNYAFAARLEAGKPVFVPDDGENRWTLTAASDFAAGLAGLVGNRNAVGESFHITSDEVMTWNEIYHEIARALGVRNPQVLTIPTEFICRAAPELTGNLKGDKSHPGIFDNSKIKRFVPGFACRKPFGEGIRESVAHLRAHPEDRIMNAETEALIEKVVQAWSRHGG